MRRNGKQFLSLCLCVAMLAGSVPANAYATVSTDGAEATQTKEETQEAEANESAEEVEVVEVSENTDILEEAGEITIHEIKEDIKQNVTFLSGHTYHIKSNITVYPDVTLTVQEGASILFGNEGGVSQSYDDPDWYDKAGTYVTIEGHLVINGTQDNPVTVKSRFPDPTQEHPENYQCFSGFVFKAGSVDNSEVAQVTADINWCNFIGGGFGSSEAGIISVRHGNLAKQQEYHIDIKNSTFTKTSYSFTYNYSAWPHGFNENIRGDAIYVSTNSTDVTEIKATNCTFGGEDNTGLIGRVITGGGASHTYTFDNCLFRSCASSHREGDYMIQVSEDTALTVRNSHFISGNDKSHPFPFAKKDSYRDDFSRRLDEPKADSFVIENNTYELSYAQDATWNDRLYDVPLKKLHIYGNMQMSTADMIRIAENGELIVGPDGNIAIDYNVDPAMRRVYIILGKNAVLSGLKVYNEALEEVAIPSTHEECVLYSDDGKWIYKPDFKFATGVTFKPNIMGTYEANTTGWYEVEMIPADADYINFGLYNRGNGGVVYRGGKRYVAVGGTNVEATIAPYLYRGRVNCTEKVFTMTSGTNVNSLNATYDKPVIGNMPDTVPDVDCGNDEAIYQAQVVWSEGKDGTRHWRIMEPTERFREGYDYRAELIVYFSPGYQIKKGYQIVCVNGRYVYEQSQSAIIYETAEFMELYNPVTLNVVSGTAQVNYQDSKKDLVYEIAAQGYELKRIEIAGSGVTDYYYTCTTNDAGNMVITISYSYLYKLSTIGRKEIKFLFNKNGSATSSFNYLPKNTQKAESVTLNAKTKGLSPKETFTLVATILPENTENKSVSWTTSDAKVATVSDTGVVTAVGAGTATITCTAKDGSNVSATCNILVFNPAESFVARIYTTAYGREGDLAGLTYWGKEITSGNRTPAAVAEQFFTAKEFTDKNLGNGEYVKVLYKTFMNREADAGGLAYWVGRLDQGESRVKILREMAGSGEFKNIIKSFGLPDEVKVTGITLNKKSAALAPKATLQLSATIAPANATNKTVTWTSSNSKVATVSSTGKVTAVAAGTATITCKAADGSGKSATCSVTVYTNTESFVARIYTMALGREPEANGLKYWAGEINAKRKTPAAVVEQFIFSPEFTKKNLNNTEYVKVLYRIFMDREADQGGMNYWVGQLGKGVSRQSVLRSFAGCQEFKKIMASFGL